jgi:hypothetical protein
LENGYLVVPRIDFDGYGALELTFRLDFDGEWVLILEQATEASLSISNSGVFDPVQFTIDVNEIELDTGALYAVQLKLLSQTDYFVFSIAEAVHLNPLPAFDHSAEALPPSGWPPADYIPRTTSLGSSSSCDTSCASLFAEYILGASNKSNQQVTSQAQAVAAGPREQARRIHDRLVGIPPDPATLDAMTSLISEGNPQGAADLAMTDPNFYRNVLKNWITPWTNEAESVFAPLNDYTATVIGMIRDDVPFNQVLTADLVYVGAPGVVSTPYSQSDNQHYQELEDDRIDLSDPEQLIPVMQSTLSGSQLSAADTAGVITTRAAGEAFFSAGTNRRMWRFTAMNFLCQDMEDLHDITRPADRIRQDVNRSPGGDSSIFNNQCVGCHSGMDPMAGAYAYYEWDDEQGRVMYTPGEVQNKYLINSGFFPQGFITINDRWDNYWREGQNYNLGWREPMSTGYGVKSLGAEVTNSRAFSLCQVEKVFEKVCFHPPGNPTERGEVNRIADVFESENYNIKRVFSEVATYCMGG